MKKLRHVVHEDPQLILGDAIHRLDGLDTTSARAKQVGGWVGGRVGGISLDGALLRGMPLDSNNISEISLDRHAVVIYREVLVLLDRNKNCILS